MNNDQLLIDKAYVEISSYRLRAVKSLGKSLKTPTELAHDSDIRVNHMSNVLTQLRHKGLVECINPEMRKGKLYRLTSKGLEILEVL